MNSIGLTLMEFFYVGQNAGPPTFSVLNHGVSQTEQRSALKIYEASTNPYSHSDDAVRLRALVFGEHDGEFSNSGERAAGDSELARRNGNRKPAAACREVDVQ